MPFQTLTHKERSSLIALGIGIGIFLALGFIPMSYTLVGSVFSSLSLSSEIADRLFFPLMALLFAVSLPASEPKKALDTEFLLKSSALPFVLAVVFGMIVNRDSASETCDTQIWILLAVPFGEELLFRQWMYRIGRRLWGDRFFTATNPFPAAVVFSSIGFSLWHVQNFSVFPFSLALFQMLYTVFTGLWLGTLRERTGRLWPCILAHFLINFGSTLKLPASW